MNNKKLTKKEVERFVNAVLGLDGLDELKRKRGETKEECIRRVVFGYRR